MSGTMYGYVIARVIEDGSLRFRRRTLRRVQVVDIAAVHPGMECDELALAVKFDDLRDAARTWLRLADDRFKIYRVEQHAPGSKELVRDVVEHRPRLSAAWAIELEDGQYYAATVPTRAGALEQATLFANEPELLAQIARRWLGGQLLPAHVVRVTEQQFPGNFTFYEVC